MKKLLGLVLGLMVSISSAFADLDPCRNLFDPDAYGQNTTVSLAATHGDNKIWYTGSSSSSVAIPVMPNKTYTISIGHTSSSSMFRAAVTERLLTSADNDSNPYTPVQVIRTTTPNTPITISTGSNGHYLYVQVSNVTFDADVPYLMIETGSTATSYVPYNASCHTTCPNGQVLQTYTSATGTVTQNGTPTPANPITPTFYTQGSMVLRKIDDTYKDSYDATTGKITRRVGYAELDGTETWGRFDQTMDVIYGSVLSGANTNTRRALSNALYFNSSHQSTSALTTNEFFKGDNNAPNRIYINLGTYTDTTIADWKTYLAEQYAAGTPVTVWYPLATAVEEDWTETSYCQSAIKIATTAYNSARFSPVVNDLNDTIATIRDVVTNTINQTKAIADLQATKQTRPDENCPAGKKCLLVEDNDGTPHWYEIIENAYGLPTGYTALEYIESTGTQYIDTGLKGNLNTKVEIDMQIPEYTSSYVGYFMGSRTAQNNDAFLIGSSDASLSQNGKYFAQFDSVTPSSGTGPKFDLNRHVLSLSSSGFYVDNQLYISYSNPQSFTTQENIPLFARYSAGTLANGAFRVFSFKMYNNSTLVRNLIPAKNSSNVIGMYDTVNDVFYTNQGTGTFTAGPVVQ